MSITTLDIDPASGALLFPDLKCELLPGAARSALPVALQPLVIGARDMKTGYIWNDLRPVKLRGEELAGSLCYFHEKLDRVMFNISDGGKEWPDAKTSKAHEALFGKIFKEVFQRPFPGGQETFPWGKVYYGYDDKGGFTCGGWTYVNYNG